MNNKLQNELSRIVDIDPRVMQQKQTMWMVAAQERMNFIKKLLSNMKNMEFDSKKESSKYYSDAVVNYDRDNMIVFY